MKTPTIRQSGLMEPPAGPAFLLYDIEITPTVAYVWSAYKTNIIEVKEPWYMLSFAYKWLGSKRVGFVSIKQDGSTDDQPVAGALAALFDRADVVIAHNGDRFDQKKANSRFLYHGIDQPSPYQTIDTLREAKRYFGEIQFSLKALAQRFGLSLKEENRGFPLWKECMAGDKKAWKEMERYNRQDVKSLEDLYLLIRPYIGTPGKKAHPNRAHWQKGDFVCPKCGSDNVQKRGWHRTIVSEFPTIFCNNCKGYSRLRERKSQKDGQFVRAL